MRELGPTFYYSPDDGVAGPAGKDLQPIQDERVPFGNSDVLISKELQLECPLVGDTSYEAQKSILIFGEPHHVAEAQFSLFKGLETFFRDNPKLVGQTVLLAEGFPANELISVDQLIDVDPHPSDELIRQTLDSFLITGYMAYEWKHHEDNHIPIIGTEHPELYALSREFATWTVDDPNAILAEVAIKETENSGHTYRFPVSAGWKFAINARNQFIASTTMNFVRNYENIILFVGGGHILTRQDDFEFDMLQQIAIGQVANGSGIFGQYLQTVNPADLQNHSISGYLGPEKVGFSHLEPFGLNSKKEEMAYQQLFEAQRKGTSGNQQNIDYEGYLDWLLKTKRLKPGQHTTVQPDPKAAADFVRRLKEQQRQEQELEKSGVVYEKPADDWTKYDWFEISPEEERKILGKDTIWGQGIDPQGHDFETIRRANLASNCPHIDDIVIDAMTVTQFKSMDLTLSSYHDPRTMQLKVEEYIDHLDERTKGRWSWTDKETDRHYDFERGVNFQDRYLELAIPLGKATRAQTEKLLDLHDYAESKDVTLVIVEVP